MSRRDETAGLPSRHQTRKLKSIGAVASELGLPPHVLRFWEERFPDIGPTRTNGGRRLYTPDQVALLRGIRALLHDDGMTIRGVKRALEQRGPEAVAARGRAEVQLTVVPAISTVLTERPAGPAKKKGRRAAASENGSLHLERLREDISQLEKALARLRRR